VTKVGYFGGGIKLNFNKTSLFVLFCFDLTLVLRLFKNEFSID